MWDRIRLQDPLEDTDMRNQARAHSSSWASSGCPWIHCGAGRGGGGGGDWSYPPLAVQARKMGTSSALETSFFFFLRLDLLLERGEGWGKRGRET